MSEEKKEYNTMEEETISNKETEEILEEDDVRKDRRKERTFRKKEKR